VNAINADVVATLREGEIAARLKTLGLTVVANTPAQATAFIQAESRRWRDIIVKADIKGQYDVGPARRLYRSAPFLRLVRLSVRILVDCIAVWLRLA
jgi:Tripartite tricarboxylate transporter family receptor